MMKNNGGMPTVSFFTNCYENDWEKVLKEDRLEHMIKRCNVDFYEKVLIINNVKNRDLVEQYAKEAVNKGIIDTYHFALDYMAEILPKYKISRESFKLDFYDGYYYSTSPLTAVHLAKGQYLLYFTCDCMIAEGGTGQWIPDAIEEMQRNRFVFTATPYWDNNLEEAKGSNFKIKDDFIYSTGFSDRCFFVETKRMQADIYNCWHYASEAYPKYAGELFEKRVFSYMVQNKLVRIISSTDYYDHIKLLNDGVADIHKSVAFKVVLRRKAASMKRFIRKAINRRLLGHRKVFDYSQFESGYNHTPVVPMETMPLRKTV